MTKSFVHEAKSRAMGLFWVTARQVVWRSQPHAPASAPEKKDAPEKKHDHPRR